MLRRESGRQPASVSDVELGIAATLLLIIVVLTTVVVPGLI